MAWKEAVSKLTGKVSDFYELKNEHAKSNYPQWIYDGGQYFWLECYEMGNYMTVTEEELNVMEQNEFGILIDKEQNV